MGIGAGVAELKGLAARLCTSCMKRHVKTQREWQSMQCDTMGNYQHAHCNSENRDSSGRKQREQVLRKTLFLNAEQEQSNLKRRMAICQNVGN